MDRFSAGDQREQAQQAEADDGVLMTEVPEHFDDMQRRCPRLGGTVSFAYCRTGVGPEPCFKVFDCWWESFDVVAHLEQCLTAEQFERLSHPAPADKILNLLEIVKQVRERHGHES